MTFGVLAAVALFSTGVVSGLVSLPSGWENLAVHVVLGDTTGLPDDAKAALFATQSVVIYSLGPMTLLKKPGAVGWEAQQGPGFFYGFSILGQSPIEGLVLAGAVKEFRAAIEPHFGLRRGLVDLCLGPEPERLRCLAEYDKFWSD